MSSNSSLGSNSGESWNRIIKTSREADKTAMVSHFTEDQPALRLLNGGDFLIIWIPAFAGMTQFLLMDYLG